MRKGRGRSYHGQAGQEAVSHRISTLCLKHIAAVVRYLRLTTNHSNVFILLIFSRSHREFSSLTDR